jgi:DNA-binding XRE family transcriptional regulator
MKIDRDFHCQRFGEALRRHRQDADLSMDELGDLAGLHRSEICKLEKAHREPRLTTIIKVARGLQVTPARLLENVDPLGSDGRSEAPLPPSAVVVRGPGRRPQGGKEASVLPAGAAPCPGPRRTTDDDPARGTA